MKAQVGSPQALRLAAENGDLKRLQQLLDQLTDINSRDDAGRTALLLATLHGQSKAAELLLAHGANPNVPDAEGVTPLSAAVAGNHSTLIRMLKRAGAR
ncbi:MAG TPA: ankyrin repeat domain-containing protein [Steroidobacteraceae bacterium]